MKLDQDCFLSIIGVIKSVEIIVYSEITDKVCTISQIR